MGQKKEEHRRCRLRSGRRPFGAEWDSGGAPDVRVHLPQNWRYRRVRSGNVDAFFPRHAFFFWGRRRAGADIAPVKPGRL